MTLDEEAKRATELLVDKVVQEVIRHREREVVIVFTDGTRFFADAKGPLDLSIT